VRGLGFGVEVLVGALVYIPSALVLARGTSMDLIELVRDQIRSRRNRGKGEEEDDEA
jgi:hypothetical protein